MTSTNNACPAGLAVDQGFVSAKATNRRRDPREFVRVISAASGPERDVLALLAGKDAEAVVLDLIQPTRPGGRAGDEARIRGCRRTAHRRRHVGLDESGRRDALTLSEA
jgi:hypothetical protein